METMRNLLSLFNEKPEATCFVMKEGKVIFSSEARGVAPLLEFYKNNGQGTELTLVDRIVGRGAMFLAVLAGANIIVTRVISSPALDIARQFGVEVDYLKEVPAIMNRTGDGFCPIETAVLGENDPEGAYETILSVLKDLRSGKADA